mmetsp:Transcript_41170/g.76530  ORF Transcript_41170/g.76530 Transcript_41170/m.76530 type:complete len:206 (+) Transcript_41170:60-677(+)
MSSTPEPPEESTLLRVSRGLGVAFWALAVSDGLYMILTLRSHTLWQGVHNLCAGLLLVLVASACGVWEVKAVQSRLDAGSRFLKVGRELFLAGMYFVVAGFLSTPSDSSKSQEAAIVGRSLCIFGWLLALLRVLLTLIPCMARRTAEGPAEPLRTTAASEPQEAEPQSAEAARPAAQSRPSEAEKLSTGTTGLCPDVPRYSPGSG